MGLDFVLELGDLVPAPRGVGARGHLCSRFDHAGEGIEHEVVPLHATGEDLFFPFSQALASLVFFGNDTVVGAALVEGHVDVDALLDDALGDVFAVLVGAVGLHVTGVDEGVYTCVEAVPHGLRVDAVGSYVLAELVGLLSDGGELVHVE